MTRNPARALTCAFAIAIVMQTYVTVVGDAPAAAQDSSASRQERLFPVTDLGLLESPDRATLPFQYMLVVGR